VAGGYSLQKELGIVGGGVMAEAIVSRLLAVGVYEAEAVVISDPLEARRDFLHQQYGVAVTNSNQEVVEATSIVLAVKPQALRSAVSGLNVAADRLIISILAGVSISQLEKVFPQQSIIRTMPNTPATVGAGMTAIAGNERVTDVQYALVSKIFQAVGKVVRVSESQLDAVTGLSGSGPAYVALMVEALADGGVAAGLPRAMAQELALQTVLGTAQLLDQQQLHPAICKDRVTSPGGTTIAGVRALEKGGFRSTIMEAVIAAANRSQELNQG
jgi:pyrroline-5-carboxylate reductase